MNKKAYSLAEIFIMLVVIGVIADLVIPHFLNAHQQKMTLSKAQSSAENIQKFDNQMNKAITLSQVENGHISDWKIDNIEAFMANYIKPYLRISKDCGIRQTCWLEDEYLKNGGNPIFVNNKKAIYKAILIDGTFVVAYVTAISDGKRKVHIHTDTNGAELPNKKGEDISEFIISNKPSQSGLYYYPVE